MNSNSTLPSMPTEIRTTESFTNLLDRVRFFSLNDLAKNRDTPVGIPIDAIVANIVAIEIAAEDVPMISGEAILARVIHNK